MVNILLNHLYKCIYVNIYSYIYAHLYTSQAFPSILGKHIIYLSLLLLLKVYPGMKTKAKLSKLYQSIASHSSRSSGGSSSSSNSSSN